LHIFGQVNFHLSIRLRLLSISIKYLILSSARKTKGGDAWWADGEQYGEMKRTAMNGVGYAKDLPIGKKLE